MIRMIDLPPSLAYYGSCAGIVQILEHNSLPLFQAHEMRDPFLPNKNSELGFECQDLFESSVKYMTAAILGKSAPRGNPNHPLQKAIMRWRGENRFADEAEIRDSLIGLMPAMVEKSFEHAKEIHQKWLAFIENKRILSFYESYSDEGLWLSEAEHFSGAVIKLKCADGSVLEQCLPVKYSRLPSQIVGVEPTVELMVGELNEMPTDFNSLILAQNYQSRAQKEWRLVVDRLPDDEFCLNFSSDLIQSVYIGAMASMAEQEKIGDLIKKLGRKINLYRAVCRETCYGFRFEKLS